MSIDCRCDICKFTLSDGDSTYCGDCYNKLEVEIQTLEEQLDQANTRLGEYEVEIQKLEEQLDQANTV